MKYRRYRQGGIGGFRSATRVLDYGAEMLFMALVIVLVTLCSLSYLYFADARHEGEDEAIYRTSHVLERKVLELERQLAQGVLFMLQGPPEPALPSLPSQPGGSGAGIRVWPLDGGGAVWLSPGALPAGAGLDEAWFARVLRFRELPRPGGAMFAAVRFHYLDAAGRYVLAYGDAAPPSASLQAMLTGAARVPAPGNGRATWWLLPDCRCLAGVLPVSTHGRLLASVPLSAFDRILPAGWAFSLSDGARHAWLPLGRVTGETFVREVRVGDLSLFLRLGVPRGGGHGGGWLLTVHVAVGVLLLFLLGLAYGLVRRRLVSPVLAGMLSMERTRDQLARRNAELSYNGRLLREVTDLMPGGLYRVRVRDDEVRFLFVNQRFRTLLGLEDVPRREWGAVIESRLSAEDRRRLRSLLRGEVSRIQLAMAQCDEVRWYEVEGVGRSLGEAGMLLTGMWMDVTQARRHAAALKDARDRAMHADQARAQFLAVMSHEIRTPLNGLMGMIELLPGSGEWSERQERYLGLIQSSGALLLRVISDILDFSRIQSGRLEMDPQPVDLHVLLRDAADRARASLEAAATPVAVELQLAEGPLWVKLDAFRIMQIVGNLLSNAIKFTREGRITMSLMQERIDDERLQLQLSVTDTGCGMSPDALNALFTPFVQGDSSTARRHGGTGLGLSICRALAEQMGGAITVTSTQGVGSTFHVWLVCEMAAPVLPSVSASAPLPAPVMPRVLVVEDHPLNRAVLKLQLDTLGVEAVVVESAALALAWLREGGHCALVLTDISMPEMDGYALTRAIRDDPALEALPVVMVSAHAYLGDRERAFAAGANGFLTKPVLLDDLRDALAAFGRSGEAPPPPPPPDPTSGLDALLAAFKGDVARVLPVVEAFVAADLADRQTLASLLASGERAALAERAHRMAGAARYVNAAYADCLQALEDAAQAGDATRLQLLIGKVLQMSTALHAACAALRDDARHEKRNA